MVLFTIPQDVNRSSRRVPNLTQYNIPSSDATHQPILLFTIHQDATETVGEYLTLRSTPYLLQMQLQIHGALHHSTRCNQKHYESTNFEVQHIFLRCNSPTHGALHHSTRCKQKQYESTYLRKYTIPSSDATHQHLVHLKFHKM